MKIYRKSSIFLIFILLIILLSTCKVGEDEIIVISEGTEETVSNSQSGFCSSLDGFPQNPYIIDNTSIIGDDYDYANQASDLLDLGNGIIKDQVTGLFWQKDSQTSFPSATAASDYCNNLALGDLIWRLPDACEMFSIWNYNFPSSPGSISTDNHFFQPILWSSGYGKFWIENNGSLVNLNLLSGSQMYGYGGFSSEFSIKCVSGRTAEPKKVLQVQTNIVIDSGTGFMWEKNHEEHKSWVEAIEYCENLVLDGYSDWRLPDAFELFTLMDPEFQSGLNYSVFGINNIVNNGAIFWTSTQNTSLHASVIDFSNNFNIGNPGYGYSKSALMSVKCLRN